MLRARRCGGRRARWPVSTCPAGWPSTASLRPPPRSPRARAHSPTARWANPWTEAAVPQPPRRGVQAPIAIASLGRHMREARGTEARLKGAPVGVAPALLRTVLCEPGVPWTTARSVPSALRAQVFRLDGREADRQHERVDQPAARSRAAIDSGGGWHLCGRVMVSVLRLESRISRNLSQECRSSSSSGHGTLKASEGRYSHDAFGLRARRRQTQARTAATVGERGSGALRWEESQPVDPEAPPGAGAAPSTPPRPGDRHSASAEAAALRWREQHADDEED